MARARSIMFMALLTVCIMAAQAVLPPGGGGNRGYDGGSATAQPIDIAPSLMEIELVTLSESTIAVSFIDIVFVHHYTACKGGTRYMPPQLNAVYILNIVDQYAVLAVGDIEHFITNDKITGFFGGDSGK